MRAWSSRIELVLAMTVVIAAVAPVRGQQCDDGNACTTSDMCVSEECEGTPATTGSCDDGNDCTVNDRCVPVSPTEPDGCMGDPAPVGTDCQGGCGTCQSVSSTPIPGQPVFCTAKPDIADQPCESSSIDIPCTDDRCRVQAGNFVTCSHRTKSVPTRMATRVPTRVIPKPVNAQSTPRAVSRYASSAIRATGGVSPRTLAPPATISTSVRLKVGASTSRVSHSACPVCRRCSRRRPRRRSSRRPRRRRLRSGSTRRRRRRHRAPALATATTTCRSASTSSSWGRTSRWTWRSWANVPSSMRTTTGARR